MGESESAAKVQEERISPLHRAAFNLPRSYARGIFESFLIGAFVPPILLVRQGFIPLPINGNAEALPLVLSPLSDLAVQINDAIAKGIDPTPLVTPAWKASEVRLDSDGNVIGGGVLGHRLSSSPNFTTSTEDVTYFRHGNSSPGLLIDDIGDSNPLGVAFYNPKSFPQMNFDMPSVIAIPCFGRVEVYRAMMVAYDCWLEEMQLRLGYDAVSGE